MKDILKYIALTILGIAAILVMFKFSSCESEKNNQNDMFIPADTNYVPVQKITYTPKSTPFESASKQPAKLPQGVRERDVKRVIDVKSTPKDTLHRCPYSLQMIETKDGNFYLKKDSGWVTSLKVTDYEPTILDFGVHLSLGVTLAFSSVNMLSPCAAMAPLEVCGCVQLPLLAVDIQSIGAGAAWRKNDWSFGVMMHWSWKLKREIKLSATFNLD
jgi:hypothetical protein